VVGIAVLDDDVVRGDAELVADDLRERRLVSLALGLRPDLQDRLAGGVHPQLRGVEHLDAEDVVLAAVAGSERLGHHGDADPEPSSLGQGCLLLAQEVLVADGFQPDVEALLVLSRVDEEPEGRAVWELLVLEKVDPPQFGRVHAQVGGGRLDDALLEEHRFRHPERAPIRDSTRRFVGVGALIRDMTVRNVITGEG
jgi:hypothetical protein